MAETINMLRNVIRTEDPHTELLYNLMQLDEVRRTVLSRLFSADCASRTAHRDLCTQADLGGSGCADLLIENSDVCAILEVKVSERCGLTKNQPTGYLRFLLRQKQPDRRLTFLVPKRWVYRTECSSRIMALARPDIKTAIVEWEDLIELLESKELINLNPILTEFTKLLVERYNTRPVNFSSAEADVLFSTETAAAVSKLYGLIKSIREESGDYHQSGQRADPHGIYFHDHRGKEIFWIGNWPQFWISTGNPIAFGVSKAVSPNVGKAFVESYKGNTMPFDDGNGEYTVGWVSKDEFAGLDAVDRIWSKIQPVLDAVTKASENEG